MEHMKGVTTWLVSLSIRDKFSWSGIEPPTTSFGFGFLSTII